MATATVNRQATCYETKMIVGEKNYHYEGVVLFSPNEKIFYGETNIVFVVAEGYGLHSVEGEGLRKGYVIRREDGATYFATAGNLRDMDGRPRHLQLVRTPPKRNAKRVTHG